MRAYLGIDVGTSGLKAALIEEGGRLVTATEDLYAVSTPAPGQVEADPREWVAAATAAVGRMAGPLARANVAAIGVAGQMHGAILCDESGQPVAPAILWPDRRAEATLESWRNLPDSRLAALANPLVPGMTGPILAWLADQRPDVVDRAAVVLHAKDVVRHALTSHPAESRPPTDRSDASATLLWDVPRDRWDEDVARAVGVPVRLLPAALPSYQDVGRTDWLSRIIPGGSGDVAVAAGAGDTPAAGLAVGSTGIHISLGTGAQVIVRRPSAANPGADPSTHLYADAGDGWYAMAALQNGGLALDQAARLLGMNWDELIAAAARGRARAVSFLPFFTGERGGVASPSSLGGWLGVGIETTRDDLSRAAVEGVLFSIRRGLELLGTQASPGSSELTLSGGGWRSPLLVQLAADVLGRPVRRIAVRSASAVGAAMLAARCAGAELTVDRFVDPPVDPTASVELEDRYLRWLNRCAAADSSGR